ncbi:MAG: YlxR family protein, partial [Bacilli bacterium]|nr:YlxR family protein [Bacilli bacterium]
LNKEVILKAKKTKVLDRHLEIEVPDSIYDELLAMAEVKES